MSIKFLHVSMGGKGRKRELDFLLTFVSRGSSGASRPSLKHRICSVM